MGINTSGTWLRRVEFGKDVELKWTLISPVERSSLHVSANKVHKIFHLVLQQHNDASFPETVGLQVTAWDTPISHFIAHS